MTIGNNSGIELPTLLLRERSCNPSDEAGKTYQQVGWRTLVEAVMTLFGAVPVDVFAGEARVLVVTETSSQALFAARHDLLAHTTGQVAVPLLQNVVLVGRLRTSIGLNYEKSIANISWRITQ